jgi:O-antigen/teichoic acid export membrane protein
MICVLLLSAFSYEIVHLFAQTAVYYIAWTIIPILSMALYFGMLKDTASTGLQITKKTGIISFITIATTLLNVGLNYLLIPMYSYYGAAFAFMLSQILFFILMYVYAQRNYPIPYELKKVLIVTIIGSALCAITYFMNDLGVVVRIMVKILLVVAFPWILFAFGFFEQIEIQRLKQAWIKWRNPSQWMKNLKNVKMDF